MARAAQRRVCVPRAVAETLAEEHQILDDLLGHARVVLQVKPGDAVQVTAVTHQPGERGNGAGAGATVAKPRVLRGGREGLLATAQCF